MEIVITNENLSTIITSLNEQSGTIGHHEASMSLYSKDGVNLRLESYCECENKEIVDEEAKVEQDQKLKEALAELNEKAAAAGLSLDEYEAKVKNEEKEQQIANLINNKEHSEEDEEFSGENEGLSEEEARARVEKQYQLQDKWNVDEFLRIQNENPKLDEEGNAITVTEENMDQEAFKAWVRARKLGFYGQDPTKTIVVIYNVAAPHVVYSFDVNITGISGFNIIDNDNVKEYKQETIPTLDEFKNDIAEYIGRDTFTKGLAFVSRIANDTITINIEE